jgi:glycine C-acetyltransferase
MDSHGFGMASVRFICGTRTATKLRRSWPIFGMEDAILYSSCFDANGGLFETLLGAEDAIISDALNHASIIDGVRLCKAKRFRYANNDMQELEARLKEAREAGARHVLIATDGVFSMDGVIANLKASAIWRINTTRW